MGVPGRPRLCEAGWLVRRFEDNGDISWWLSAEGDLALDTYALIATTEGREN